MTLQPKKLFLIDGLGALLSAFLLGFVLVRFESNFGMPRNVLYILAFIACVLAAYSLTNYFLINSVQKLYLKIIGWANLCYCCLTLGFVFYVYEKITYLGFLYFSAEAIIIINLARLELRAAKKYR